MCSGTRSGPRHRSTAPRRRSGRCSATLRQCLEPEALPRVEGEAEVGTRLSITFTLSGGAPWSCGRRCLVAGARPRSRGWAAYVPGIRWRASVRDPRGRTRTCSLRQGERFRGVLVPFLRKLIEVDMAATFVAVNERASACGLSSSAPRTLRDRVGHAVTRPAAQIVGRSGSAGGGGLPTASRCGASRRGWGSRRPSLYKHVGSKECIGGAADRGGVAGAGTAR